MTDIAAAGTLSKSMAAAKALVAGAQAFIDAVRPELVISGGFDNADAWALSGFSISDGRAYYATSMANLSTVEQTIAITGGESYRVRFTLAAADGLALPATLYVELGGARVDLVDVGDHDLEIVAGSADAMIRLAARTTEGVSACVYIDDVSVTPLTEAADRVHLAAYVPDEADGFDRPFALISGQGDGASRSIGTAASLASGTYKVLLERQIPADYQPDAQSSNAELWFKNWVGQIVDQMWVLSAAPGYLLVREIRLSDGPWRGVKNADDEHIFRCWLDLRWGLE